MDQIAFISDIHGNIDALDAVLQDIDLRGIGVIYCLGDIVGYGASPAECVHSVRERCAGSVIGNHDQLTVEGADKYVLSERVAAGIRHAEKELSKNDIRWLAGLPYSIQNNQFTMVHSSLSNPECFNYVTDEIDARLHFKNQETAISFLGHTHVPMIMEWRNGDSYLNEIKEGDKLLNTLSSHAINVGSVGQPRDCDSRASYCVYDQDLSSIEIRRVCYSIEKAQDKIKKAGLPLVNAVRLSSGN